MLELWLEEAFLHIEVTSLETFLDSSGAFRLIQLPRSALNQPHDYFTLQATSIDSLCVTHDFVKGCWTSFIPLSLFVFHFRNQCVMIVYAVDPLTLMFHNFILFSKIHNETKIADWKNYYSHWTELEVCKENKN